MERRDRPLPQRLRQAAHPARQPLAPAPLPALQRGRLRALPLPAVDGHAPRAQGLAVRGESPGHHSALPGKESRAMKAVVFHGIGDIRLEDVAEPMIEEPTDAIVRLTRERHLRHGPAHDPRHHAGHEAGHHPRPRGRGRASRSWARTCATSPWATGWSSPPPSRAAAASYCRAGYYAQCDEANPNGPLAGTAFFGGPEMSGPFHGLQAEKARVPFANVGLVKLPDEVTDEQAILALGHLPHRLLRRGAGGDPARRHRGGVRLRAGGPVRHRQRQAAGRRPRLRASTASRTGWTWPAPRAPRSSTSTGGSGGDAAPAHRRHRRGPGHRRGGRGRHAPAPRARRPRRPRRRRAEFKREVKEVAPKTNPDGGNWVPGRRARAGAAVGRGGRWPRRARCPSSASTRRRRARSPSARR